VYAQEKKTETEHDKKAERKLGPRDIGRIEYNPPEFGHTNGTTSDPKSSPIPVKDTKDRAKALLSKITKKQSSSNSDKNESKPKRRNTFENETKNKQNNDQENKSSEYCKKRQSCPGNKSKPSIMKMNKDQKKI